MGASEFWARWSARLHSSADIEAGIKDLKGNETAEALSMKGHLRSLQMRWREADELLERASLLILSSKEESEEMARMALRHECFAREHELITGVRIAQSTEDGSWLAVADKKLQALIDTLTYLDAAETAMAGDLEKARDICLGWLEHNRERNVPKGGWHLGSGLFECALGEVETGLESLELAGFHVQVSYRLFSQARFAARLIAAYELIDEPRLAEEWRHFLLRLPCPSETKTALTKRASAFESMGLAVFV